MPMTTRRGFLQFGGATALALVAAPRLLHLKAPSVHAQAIPGAPTFRGAAGTAVVGPVSLAAGITVLRAQHNGTGNFIVNTFVPDDGYSPADAFTQSQTTDNALVYDVIGSYKGGSVVVTALNAPYYLAVNASAAWQVSVEQPLPETVAATQGTSFSSKGQDITPYFTLPDGIAQIALQADKSSAITGFLYHLDDLGGEAIQAGEMGHTGAIFFFNDPANQVSYPINLPDDGPYVFFVTNDLHDTTAWTVSFA